MEELKEENGNLNLKGFEVSALKKETIDSLFNELTIELSKRKSI